MEPNPSIWTVLKLWFFYFLPFVAAVPGIGKVEDADCIFVQAFGRNDYTDAELGKTLWKLRTKVGRSDLDSMVLLTYHGFDPGNANRALAKLALRVAKKQGIPIIAQWEVVFAIYQMDMQWYVENQNQIDCLWPPQEGYFATWHVKLFSKERMQKRGLHRPLEVAHPAMITRAVPVIWGLGLNPIVQPVSALEFTKHELWVWDPKSIQPWTRKFVPDWWLREIPGRALHVIGSLAPKPVAQILVSKGLPGQWLSFKPHLST